MRNFLDLVVWKKSHLLALDIYKISGNFPTREIFGLTSQIRRCSTSIPTNISEGCGRNSDAEMKRFLTIANGSCSELYYLIILSHDLNYISNKLFKELQDRIIEIQKMIYKFINNLGVNTVAPITSYITPGPNT